MKKLFVSIVVLFISLYTIAQDFNTVGSATTIVDNNEFQLTPDEIVGGGQAGAVWYKKK
jgi:hypothetical protein